jgi:hypothetical protein
MCCRTRPRGRGCRRAWPHRRRSRSPRGTRRSTWEWWRQAAQSSLQRTARSRTTKRGLVRRRRRRGTGAQADVLAPPQSRSLVGHGPEQALELDPPRPYTPAGQGVHAPGDVARPAEQEPRGTSRSRLRWARPAAGRTCRPGKACRPRWWRRPPSRSRGRTAPNTTRSSGRWRSRRYPRGTAPSRWRSGGRSSCRRCPQGRACRPPRSRRQWSKSPRRTGRCKRRSWSRPGRRCPQGRACTWLRLRRPTSTTPRGTARCTRRWSALWWRRTRPGGHGVHAAVAPPPVE